MHRRAAIAAVVAAAGALLAAGCTPVCGATPGKLRELRRGMSYDEAAQVMGCPGVVVTSRGPSDGGASTVEWDGPTAMVMGQTQIDFVDGRLQSFTTGYRGGL